MRARLASFAGVFAPTSIAVDVRGPTMQAVVIDDTSPRIDYVTAWYHQTGQGTDYNQTVAISGNPNSAFEFTFNGTSISVYGSIPPNDTAVSAYAIDLSSPVSYTNPNVTQYASHQLFYKSPDLPDGTHTLTVSVPNSTIGLPWTPMYFDYLTYIPSSSGNASSSTTSSTGSVPSSTVPSGATVSGHKSDLKSANLGVIIPAVLVPILVSVLLLCFGWWLYRRRKSVGLGSRPTPYNTTSRDMFSTSKPPIPLASPTSATPILYNSRDSERMESPPMSVIISTSSEHPSSYSGTAARGGPLASVLPPDPLSVDTALEPVREFSHPRQMQEVDGGPLYAASIVTETAPPPYRPRSP